MVELAQKNVPNKEPKIAQKNVPNKEPNIAQKIEKQIIKKPLDVVIYNQFMGGVDQNDQKLSYYDCFRKTVRWTSKIFCRSVDYKVVNAFEFFLQYGAPITQLNFRLNLIESCFQFCNVNHNLDVSPHYPILITSEIGKQKKRTCLACSKLSSKRRFGSYECRGCPPIPRSGCYPAFHLRCFHKHHHES